jgi:hypothetical protein
MTNNKQQTAVEWYAIEMYEYFRSMFGSGIINTDILEKAKEMEKIQKFHMFNCGRQYQLTGEGTFKQVYQETYGGGEQ